MPCPGLSPQYTPSPWVIPFNLTALLNRSSWVLTSRPTHKTDFQKSTWMSHGDSNIVKLKLVYFFLQPSSSSFHVIKTWETDQNLSFPPSSSTSQSLYAMLPTPPMCLVFVFFLPSSLTLPSFRHLSSLTWTTARNSTWNSTYVL